MIPDAGINKARRALVSARLLLADGDTDGACNRAYYAMFDTATVALIATQPDIRPEMIRTHRGLIASFGQHLVTTGQVDIELGRILNQVERIRLLADYTGEPIDIEKAIWAVDQADHFIRKLVVVIGAAELDRG
ncbi:HEPN domain-containing protein [Thiocapsa marina]|uniref:HEPN domain protein n=1 Tax=Thiocapsa marina 5811 TaxID=768671 RepID=F9U930_9GAMM|nr:HEPN domain-containing protein [Thiocapsa marina]EGV19288.1 HEPN domain protein [Thiocapsa marina 5811]